MELVIQKEAVSVELSSARSLVRGDVFLTERERLLDVLAERWFIPLKTAERLVFVSTRHIEWVRLDLLAGIDELDPEAEADDDSCLARVIVELVDTQKIEGQLRYTAPPTARRLGDYLEKLHGFFPVRTDDWLYLVSSTAVTSVTPLEEKR